MLYSHSIVYICHKGIPETSVYYFGISLYLVFLHWVESLIVFLLRMIYIPEYSLLGNTHVFSQTEFPQVVFYINHLHHVIICNCQWR